jgi:nucleotide-binding universal stress UspA family protein
MEIERFVAEKDIDLVAMATHGRTGLARVVRGSVAQQVFNQVNVPVLLYRTFPEDGGESALGQ